MRRIACTLVTTSLLDCRADSIPRPDVPQQHAVTCNDARCSRAEETGRNVDIERKRTRPSPSCHFHPPYNHPMRKYQLSCNHVPIFMSIILTIHDETYMSM
ncbi:hypothetical protein Q1695_003542 [Nippostrongylus brasiliensis]|nr:hypothetical protein Q1695_003542 [Nippostrongylus brasiliensis]